MPPDTSPADDDESQSGMTGGRFPESSLQQRRKGIARAAFMLAVVLVGWLIAIAVSWSHIVSSHARLGYLIGDIGLVVPLCLATWYGFTHAKKWASPLFLVLSGALAFDVVHFTIYLIQEEFPAIPAPLYLICLSGCLLLLYWLARPEIAQITARNQS